MRWEASNLQGSARTGGRRRRSMREASAMVREAAGGAGGGRRRLCGRGRRRLCRMRAAMVLGCGRQRRCGMHPVASVRDAGGDGDVAAMRGVGDGGTLPPELALCATPSSSTSGSRMEKGRADASFYTPGPLVPVGKAIRD
jgi:hypothetical protein